MLLNLMVGIPVMLLCLVMQAIVLALCLRYYTNHARHLRPADDSQASIPTNIRLLATVMVLMLLGNVAQMLVWALLLAQLGEFDSFSTALYFSAVTFTTLGYGDIVMSSHWRLLGPLEAANGILMFGVSTAVMTAAVMDTIKHDTARLAQDRPPSRRTNG